MNLTWNPPGIAPSSSGEYQAALDPCDAAPTVRRYFDGTGWSNPYHSNWPDHLKAKCRAEPCGFLPYWNSAAVAA